MDQELVQYLDGRFQYLDERFNAIDARFETMEQRFEARVEEVKRHTGVLVEDLRYQVRLVAEGFATFVEGRYAQDQARIDERFRETQALIRSSYDHLRQRVENLERNRPT
jgi:ubiquinone biosynthesis protein UbiJ